MFISSLLAVPQPNKPDKEAADPKSYIAKECGASERLSATGAHKDQIPAALYYDNNFKVFQRELESGWFAVTQEDDPDDPYGQKKLTKVRHDRTCYHGATRIDEIVG